MSATSGSAHASTEISRAAAACEPGGRRTIGSAYHDGDLSTQAIVIFGGLDQYDDARNDVWLLTHSHALAAAQLTNTERSQANAAPPSRRPATPVSTGASARSVWWGR